MTDTTTETNALVSLNLNLPAPTVVAEQVNKAFHTIYGKIEEEIASFVPDVTTEKGRQAIASLAYKIARTKTGLDEAAKNVTADQKQIIDAVNAERSKMREDLDRLKATVRAPLDAWEDAEQARQNRVAAKRQELESLPASAALMTADQLRLAAGHIDVPFSGEEYGEDAHKLIALREATLSKLSIMIADAEKREAEAAELEQLRREKAEREAKEAAEREAEEARKREEEEKRRQEEERERIEKAAIEKAEAAKRKAGKEMLATLQGMPSFFADHPSGYIADKVKELAASTFSEELFGEYFEAVSEAKTEAIKALGELAIKRAGEEQREADREAEERIEEAKRREEEAAAKAEEDARRREEEAARKERERIQQEKAEEERQRLAQEKADQERAADLAHRKKVNSAATAAIMKAADVGEADAQAIVIAIYKGQVPNVAISY